MLSALDVMMFYPNRAAAASGGTTTTWNASDKDAGVTLSAGNLAASADDGTGSFHNVRATAAKTSGKWYFEAVLTTNGAGHFDNAGVGVANASASLAANLGVDTNSGGYYSTGFFECQTVVKTFTAAVSGDVIGIAFDADNGRLYVAVNNVWQNAAVPASGTNPIAATLGTFYPAASGGQGTVTAHFTAASQTYAPPSGFSAFG